LAEEEAKMIKGCLDGNRQAQRALYEAHKGFVFALCLRYAGNRAEAEDIMQDGFLKVYRDLHQYRPEAPLGAWIRRVMINTALEAIRKRKSRPNGKASVEDQVALSAREDTASQMNRRDLNEMVQRLPEEYRMVCNLVALEGYRHKEAAEMLGISESNSRVRLNRARGILQQQVERIFELEK
jgi:RNA polymerase sigma-70 factor (ECF subfamily)